MASSPNSILLMPKFGEKWGPLQGASHRWGRKGDTMPITLNMTDGDAGDRLAGSEEQHDQGELAGVKVN